MGNKLNKKWGFKSMGINASTYSIRLRLYFIIRKILVGYILAVIVNFIFSYFFHTPKVFSLTKDNNELLLKYQILEGEIKNGTERVALIENKDKGVYRSMFVLDTTSYNLSDKYIFGDNVEQYETNRYKEYIQQVWGSLNNFKSNLYLQTTSLDTISILVKDKGKMVEATPILWPLDRTKIKSKIGAFGYRFHPILGRWKMHEGVDLSGPIGLPIYSTADGVVITSGRESGYGLTVVVDHGFGYKTRYAHLNKIRVEKGQSVKRGEQVGDLGNTGRSTGPHLHYEVIYRGEFMNPINYLGSTMTAEEYAEVIEGAVATPYEE